MSKSRTGTWLAWILGTIAVIIIAIPALLTYLRTTASSLHPNPIEVPSEMQSRTLPPRWTSAITQAQQHVRTAMSERRLPGVSVAVGLGGNIVWAEGFGFADIEKNIAVTPSHRFRIGTASKMLTSAAAGLLLEEGRLKLDDKIQTYVPEYPQKQWPVTLRQLMAQTSGMRNHGGDDEPMQVKHCERPAEAVQYFAEYPLLFEPGTRSLDSTYGWILVSAAIEAAAKKQFLAMMRERVFDPLEMRDTLPDSFTQAIPDRATPYYPRFAANTIYGLHPLDNAIDFSCYSGSTYFLSTASDLARFGMAIPSGKLLRPATVQMMQSPQRLTSGQETGYGLGWELQIITLSSGRQVRTAGHNGEIFFGQLASILTIPEQGIAVAVLTNIAYADTFSVASKILQSFAE
jgi:CubicO group peptidase (beta-lactamase class C family)